MNKFFLIAISILLLCATASFVLPYTTFQISTGLFLDGARLIAVIMMLFNGSFINTRSSKIAVALYIIVLIGAIMKILHLTGADQILLFSFLILFILYFIHFLKKKEKGHLDLLKLLVALSYFITPPIYIYHYINPEYRDTMLLVENVIIWITFIDFIVMRILDKTIFKN